MPYNHLIFYILFTGSPRFAREDSRKNKDNMKYKNIIQNHLLAALLIININSCLSMDYIKECAHELKDNAREFSHTTQDFWKNANLLTKTAVVLGVSGASGYILLNEWRNRWNKARIKELEETELVVGAIAYGGFNSSRDKILEKIHEDKQTNKNNTREMLFEGNLGVGDHHPKTRTFLTKQINEKFFGYGEAPGYLLQEKSNELEKHMAILLIALCDIHPNDSILTSLKYARYPEKFSRDEIKNTNNTVPTIIRILKEKFSRTVFEKENLSDDEQNNTNNNSEEEEEEEDDNKNYGGPWDTTIQNSEDEETEQEIAMDPFRALEDRVAHDASDYETNEYYEELRTQAWNSIAWNKHSYTVEIATRVCNKLIAEAENKAALRKREKHLLA